MYVGKAGSGRKTVLRARAKRVFHDQKIVFDVHGHDQRLPHRHAVVFDGVFHQQLERQRGDFVPVEQGFVELNVQVEFVFKTYFQQKGIFNKDVARAFKENILEKGGSEDPMELYKKFRGREPKIDALLVRSGLA